MKKYLTGVFMVLVLIACKKEDKVAKEVDRIPVKVEIERFDKVFYESPVSDFPKIKREFYYFFPAGNPDSVWTNKMQNPLYRELYAEVKKKYPNNNAFEGDLVDLFKHIQYYFPQYKTPKVVTLVSEMDYENKAIFADSLVIISLDMYLGKDNRLYEFPQYYKQNFEPSQMMPDIVASLATKEIKTTDDRSLLAQMIYFGKELYMKDLLLPDMSDADKIAYTEEQLKWCQENESEMWKYLVNEKLLYDTNPKLTQRFISTAPFSKFYLEIDAESPGRVGTWLGWQIVRSYMKNNPDVSLQQLLVKEAKEIFDNSKYKPKK